MTQATSIDVESAFSCGHLLISHVWSCLHVQTIWALMCIKDWSQQGLIKDTDILAVTVLEEMDDANEELEDGWDAIRLT